RSVWSILGTCGLTLLICIWNATYPNMTSKGKWYKVWFYRFTLALSALVTPEITAMRAYSEWEHAGKIIQDFRAEPWLWSRTHGFFALMGGFVLQDGKEQTTLNSADELCRLENLKERIVNPEITE
ncbi:hypothetical protein PAXINDRAFT_60167, partial [Paxillus involutus ATCC 200175]